MEREVEIRFRIKLPEKTAEGMAELFLRDIKSLVNHFARVIDVTPYGFCAIIIPDDASEAWGAQDKWIK